MKIAITEPNVVLFGWFFYLLFGPIRVTFHKKNHLISNVLQHCLLCILDYNPCRHWHEVEKSPQKNKDFMSYDHFQNVSLKLTFFKLKLTLHCLTSSSLFLPQVEIISRYSTITGRNLAILF